MVLLGTTMLSEHACGVKPECLAERRHPDGSGLFGCKAQRCTRRQNSHEKEDAKGEDGLRQDQESFCKWVGMVITLGFCVGSCCYSAARCQKIELNQSVAE
jgi:hypothetical protein